MQKRRKKVPDVIRRGIRLFIGLAVCNSLGFYLSSRSATYGRLTFPARPSPAYITLATSQSDPCRACLVQASRTRFWRTMYYKARSGALLHRTTVSFARD